MKFLFQKLIFQLPLVILWCFATSMISQHVNAVSLPNNETIPAVLVFGDSIVDTGNNDYIKTIVKCNFLPYGIDFPGGNKSTGRFSNGLVPSDIIASQLGVKNILPPYLDPKLQIQDLLTGVSFASGGSGYDPLTSKLVSVLSLSAQLSQFLEYKKKLTEAVGENRTATIISKSIYIVCTGSNDIANTYEATPLRQVAYDLPSYTDFMASQASDFLQELYEQGARRIGVIGLPILGCVPSQRTLHGGQKRACWDPENQGASLFNTKLSSHMDDLQKTFPDGRFVYLDIYTPLLNMIQNPVTYGFEVADKGCCGTGDLETGIFCNRFTSKICPNASNHIFWDSFHPTQAAYNVLCTQVIENKINDFF